MSYCTFKALSQWRMFVEFQQLSSMPISPQCPLPLSLSHSLIHHFYRVCQGVCSPLGVLKITSLSFCMRCSSWLGDRAGWLLWCSLTNSVYSWNVYWHPFSAIIVITSCNMKKQLTLFSISMSNDTNQKGVSDCEILLIL